jgi:menaquinone-dependent protoporphyrinogen oxidase
MDVLIVYGTTDGYTRKVGTFIRAKAQDRGFEVTMQNVKNVKVSPLSFDGVIIAGSVHIHEYQDELRTYVAEHHHLLNAKKSIFVSVSLTATDPNSEAWDELEEVTLEFLNHTKWNPLRVIHVAGALRYTQYNFFKKVIMKRIARKAGRDMDTSQDYEYTDWPALETFVNEYLIELEHDHIPKPV